MPYIIGIDIGGTKVSVSIVTGGGRVVLRTIFPTQDVRFTLDEIKRIIRAYLDKYDKTLQNTRGIGISCAGPLDLKKGILLNPPNLSGWRNVPLKRIFARSFPLPVEIDNDANCAACAEKIFGAGKKIDNLFYYTISTGIGGGLIINGRIHHGASSDAGEIGHSIMVPGGPQCNCGKRGCLEALASGTAIARSARKKAGRKSSILKLAGKRENIDAVIVAQAALKGDRLARRIYQEAAFYLGISITNVIQTINPQMIVIGGGVSKSGKIFFEPLIKTVREFSWKRPYRSCRIVRAKLKDNVADLGAASLVIPRFIRGIQTGLPGQAGQ